MDSGSKLNPVVNYSKSNKPFIVCRFITECGKYSINLNVQNIFCIILRFLLKIGNFLNGKIVHYVQAKLTPSPEICYQ